MIFLSQSAKHFKSSKLAVQKVLAPILSGPTMTQASENAKRRASVLPGEGTLRRHLTFGLRCTRTCHHPACSTNTDSTVNRARELKVELANNAFNSVWAL